MSNPNNSIHWIKISTKTYGFAAKDIYVTIIKNDGHFGISSYYSNVKSNNLAFPRL